MAKDPTIDALQSANDQIKWLRRFVLGCILAAPVCLFIARMLPVDLTLHLAPNLQVGDTIKVKNGKASVPDPNVYAFGVYLWQQLNRWSKDGSKDYDAQINTFQNYITPACKTQLENDSKARAEAGELAQRTRSLSGIPGQAYSSSRVVQEGPDAWTVFFDANVVETLRGVQVKDTYIRFPLRVVMYDVDREKNPFSLAIDCYGGRLPERLDPSAVASKPSPTVAPVPLPPTMASAPNAPAPAVLPSDPSSETRR